MKKELIRSLLYCCLATVASPVSSHAEVVDKVVAVVGKEVIFRSEIESRVLMAKMQYPEMANDPALATSILDGLADQKIILAKASIDSIPADANTLESMTNDRFRQMTARFSSTSEMEQRLGKSILAIRQNIRDELRNQMLIDTLKRRKTAGITVTYDEVMAFYKENSSRIPDIPEMVVVAQIVKFPAVLPESRKRALDTIHDIQAQLKNGADFGDLARKYSEDPGSGRQGGDLGVVRKGQFIPAFENAGYGLREGEISDVVETRYGYHLIQLLSKEEHSMHARHILIGIDRTRLGFADVEQRLEALRKLVLDGKESFAAVAGANSEDPLSAANGGTIHAAGSTESMLQASALLPQVQQIVKELKIGDISMPVKIQPDRGEPFMAIFQLQDRIPEHKLDTEKDYAYLEERALDDKKQKLFNSWIEELRKEVYVRRSNI